MQTPAADLFKVFSTTLCVSAIALSAGCSSIPSGESAHDVPAPSYHVGDRWVYQAEDGFRVKTRWIETHEITSVGPSGISIRVTQRGDGIDSVRTEQLESPGQVLVGALYNNETRRFTVPLQRYNFPLRPGQVWNQWVENINETARTGGVINRYVVVGGWQTITTRAGTFDAVQLRVLMRLDDDEFWRWPTTCGDRVWYSPAVRGIVSEQRDAGYLERGGPDPTSVWTQHGTLELIEFASGTS